MQTVSHLQTTTISFFYNTDQSVVGYWEDRVDYKNSGSPVSVVDFGNLLADSISNDRQSLRHRLARNRQMEDRIHVAEGNGLNVACSEVYHDVRRWLLVAHADATNDLVRSGHVF